MLENEGLVVPGPLTDLDWATDSGLPPAAIALARESRSRLDDLSPDHRSCRTASGRDSSYRSIYVLAYYRRAQIGPGVAASWNDLSLHRRLSPTTAPLTGPLVAVSVLNPLLRQADQAAAARAAVARGGDGIIGSCWARFPTRAARASDVLTARTFLGQVDQMLEFTRETVEHFRRVGYLNDLEGGDQGGEG